MDQSTPVDLVTGATGLVGCNLVRLLKNQERCVRLLVRKTSNVLLFDDLPDLQFVEGDITDRNTLKKAFDGVENVYHLAAIVTVTRRMTGRIWNTNVGGTQNVIQAAQESGIHRLIYCSSVDALGLPEGVKPATEETIWNWDRLGVENAYARSKYEAHQNVLKAARAGLNTVLVCPAFMFGAYDSHPSSGKMIQAIAGHRLPGYPGGGNNFVDVENVVQGMFNAAQVGKAGEVYILGGYNLTYREIFSIIADVIHAPRPGYAIPYLVARVAGWFGDLYEQITGKLADLNTATAQAGYLRHYYDSSKAVRELGMPQTPIENAIERAAIWLQTHHMLAV